MRTIELLDAAKKHSHAPSDYALANLLGISRQRLSHWRNERELPDTLGAIKLAAILGRDPIEVIAEIEIERAERANKETTADEWRSILTRVKAGLAMFIIGGALLTPPTPVNASSIRPMETDNLQSPTLYIMSTNKNTQEPDPQALSKQPPC